jgi:hypothetical protein
LSARGQRVEHRAGGVQNLLDVRRTRAKIPELPMVAPELL